MDNDHIYEEPHLQAFVLSPRPHPVRTKLHANGRGYLEEGPVAFLTASFSEGMLAVCRPDRDRLQADLWKMVLV